MGIDKFFVSSSFCQFWGEVVSNRRQKLDLTRASTEGLGAYLLGNRLDQHSFYEVYPLYRAVSIDSST